MYDFKVRDENGDKYVYAASDMRMALVAHLIRRGTEAVKVTRKNQPESREK